MAEDATNESGVGRLFEGVSSGQQQQQFKYGESSVECTSSLEQVENRSQSTSPPYCDCDDDDDDGGPKPSDLYGEYTWKIDDFSNKKHSRQLRSDGFEVGGYSWRIIAYPQGPKEEPNNELFVVIASKPGTFPGWSHLAQFTITAVNKDHKNSKYLNFLHKFENMKENFGGCLMKTPELSDGFIDADADTLIIEAQVQVIRERVDQLFRCLDCQYRRKFVRGFLHVEKICRDFMEECGNKFAKLINDESKWSSFSRFWLNMPNDSKEHMSREKTDTIFKAIVKRFFNEKNVTSTLVMDSLYSGLKAIQGQNKKKKKRGKKSKATCEAEEIYVPMIRIEEDLFIPSDRRILKLFERVAKEEGSTREEIQDSTECDERRLTKLGRRTIEMFVLEHILSKIEVLIKEDCAKRFAKEIIQKELVEKTPTKKPSRRSMDKNNRPKDFLLPNNLEEGHNEKTSLPTPPSYNHEGHDEKIPLPTPDLVFKEINHMLISDKEIGKGGSSTVYKGQFATREVAIKVTSYKERNPLKEVLNWVQADGHPNVVTYYGYECNEEERLLYIALELCTCTLEELIVGTKELIIGTKKLVFDRSILRENKKLQMDVISGIVSGLKNLHDRGLIHRDLTPENVLIKITHTDDQWTLCSKISDMGLIKDLLGEKGAKGSPEFQSYSENRKWKPPEQKRAEMLTQKMDVYALGNIIAYILSRGASDESNGPVKSDDLVLWFENDARDALRLTESLIDHNPEERPTLKEVSVHVFFWSFQKKIDFLSDCFEYFKGLEDTSEKRKALEKCKGKPANWYESLNDKFKSEAAKGVPSGTKIKFYNYRTMIDLLRFIRNKKHHVEELKMTQVELCMLVLEWFPNLVVEIYTLVSLEFKEVDSFRKYFSEM